MSERPLGDRPWLVAATIALLVGSCAALQAARDRWLDRPEPAERLLYVESGDAVRRMAVSYRALVADIYWIRAVQHYGGDRLGRRRGRRYELLYPLLDITTSLDPYFQIAYRFGAFFLADAYPSGAGRPDQAVALLKKGLRAEPRKWEYAMDIGFVYYWAVGDFATAGEWYRRASEMPGAPNWMGPLAATVLAGGGKREAARFLWQQMLSSESEWIRRDAARRLQQLDAMDQIDAINRALRPLIVRLPPGPVSWDRLQRAGLVRGVPVDPTGVPYAINERGVVAIARESGLYPLPERWVLEQAR